jgi:hypothetical protein
MHTITILFLEDGAFVFRDGILRYSKEITMETDKKTLLVVTTCCICAVEFGLTQALEGLRQKDHRDFSCPNGHAQHYNKPEVDPRDAELIKLRAELVDARALIEKLQAELDTLKIEVELWKPRKEEVA